MLDKEEYEELTAEGAVSRPLTRTGEFGTLWGYFLSRKHEKRAAFWEFLALALALPLALPLPLSLYLCA